MHIRFQDRKGQISQSVLVVCSMNMDFLHMLPGLEGSVMDSHIFENVQSLDFRIPDRHYYLADAGY